LTQKNDGVKFPKTVKLKCGCEYKDHGWMLIRLRECPRHKKQRTTPKPKKAESRMRQSWRKIRLTHTVFGHMCSYVACLLSSSIRWLRYIPVQYVYIAKEQIIYVVDGSR